MTKPTRNKDGDDQWASINPGWVGVVLFLAIAVGLWLAGVHWL